MQIDRTLSAWDVEGIDSRARIVLVWMVGKAGGAGVVIAGQVEIAEATRMSVRTVRRVLALLEWRGVIARTFRGGRRGDDAFVSSYEVRVR